MCIEKIREAGNYRLDNSYNIRGVGRNFERGGYISHRSYRVIYDLCISVAVVCDIAMHGQVAG